MKVLDEKFFNRATGTVAKDLLGKFLVRRIGNRKMAAMITETEAYDGHDDKASHAWRGLTRRTEVMFGYPGVFYIYLCYGAHWMLNIVTREHGYPAAVLIRGAVAGGTELNGPGKVTKFLRISKEFNFQKTEPKTGLWVEDRGVVIPKNNIIAAPRVGVAYAGPVWSAKPLRFILKK